MTRIIAGRYAGRRLSVPASGARPTTDRVREAVFSTLGHRLPSWAGIRVLDLFAGSGALGLEALSRGAEAAVFVEQDRAAAAVLRRNIAALGVTRAQLVVGDALRWRPSGERFDLVLADPPYQLGSAALAAALLGLMAADALAPDALLVAERPSRDPSEPWPASWTDGPVRRYGETSIWYGRAVKEQDT